MIFDFRAPWACALLASLLVSVSQAAPSPMGLDEIFAMKNVTRLAISPAGDKVAYVVTAPDSKGVIINPAAELWLLDVGSRKSRRLAIAERSEKLSPTTTFQDLAWSPDGQSLAYIANQGKAGSRIWMHDILSGARRALNSMPEGASPGDSLAVHSFSWSPAGDRLAYIGSLNAKSSYLERNPLPKTVIMGVGDQSVVGRSYFNSDSFLAVTELSTGQTARVTSKAVIADTYNSSIAWSSKGKRLLFTGRDEGIETSNDAWSLRELFMADLGTDQVSKLGGAKGADVSPLWVPDNSIVFLGNDSRNPYVSAWALRSFDPDTRQAKVMVNDLPASETRFEVLPGRGEIVLARVTSANRQLSRVPLRTKQLFAASPAGMYVIDYSIAADEDTVAAILSDADTPPEIYIGSLQTAQFERLTDLYAEEKRKLALAEVEKIQWASKDDRFIIDGFLVKPPGFDPKKKYPLLVNIHGGPSADYPNDFYDLRFNPAFHSQVEFYAARGYLVLNPNHRGGFSYGKMFKEALREGGRLGASYDLDIAPGVDHLLRLGFVDEDKLGLMGASYGGYAAAWAVTQTRRYKAVSINDSMFNLHSDYGVTYPTMREFYHHFMGGNPLQVFHKYTRDSPLLLAGDIRTPALIRCGTQDGTMMSSSFCTQSRELYAALRERDMPVELLIHPYEGHGILDAQTSREYLEHNLDWFNFWLKGEENPDPAKTEQYKRWRKLRELYKPAH